MVHLDSGELNECKKTYMPILRQPQKMLRFFFFFLIQLSGTLVYQQSLFLGHRIKKPENNPQLSLTNTPA